MRILHILSSVVKSGGVSNILMNYYRELAKENIRFDFLVFKKLSNSYEDEIRTLGGYVYYFERPTFFNCCSYSSLKKFFRKNSKNYDAIEIHDLNMFFITALLGKKYKVKNIIAHSHTTVFADMWYKKIRNYLLFLPVKYMAKNFFACSHDAGKFAFGNKKNIIIVRNAINYEMYKYNEGVRTVVRDELGLNDKRVLLHVGQFVPIKNHEFLIKMFQALSKKRDDVILLLVGGNGSEFIKIKKYIIDHGLCNIFLLGERNDVPQLLQAADAFILPSFNEGLPLSVVEAQMSGLHCFISDTISSDVNIGKCETFDLEVGINILVTRINEYFEKLELHNRSCNELGNYDIKKEAQKLKEKYSEIIYVQR